MINNIYYTNYSKHFFTILVHEHFQLGTKYFLRLLELYINLRRTTLNM